MRTCIRSLRAFGAYVVAEVEGEIDLKDTADLADELVEITPGTAGGLVLDLTDVTYIDSAGIRMLFEVVRRLEARRQILALALPDDSPIRALLKFAGVQDAIHVCNTPEECVMTLLTEEASSDA
jgi:anti-anti-sigma factor